MNYIFRVGDNVCLNEKKNKYYKIKKTKIVNSKQVYVLEGDKKEYRHKKELYRCKEDVELSVTICKMTRSLKSM